MLNKHCLFNHTISSVHSTAFYAQSFQHIVRCFLGHSPYVNRQLFKCTYLTPINLTVPVLLLPKINLEAKP